MDIVTLYRQACNDSDDVWCFIWETFENASMTYDLASTNSSSSSLFSYLSAPFWSLWNSTRFNSNHEDRNDLFDSPAKLGIVTGLFILLFIESRIISYKIDYCLESTARRLALLVLNLIGFTLIAPFIVLTFVIFSLYRCIVAIVLKNSMGEDYCGLLEGTDCVWTIEDSGALSIINILGLLELQNDEANNRIVGSNNNSNILDNLRGLVKDRLLSPNFKKLWWARGYKYGYYYWRKTKEVNLEERIRWLNDDKYHEECHGTCHDIYGGYLRQFITKICNQPLPEENSVGWEILIGNVCKAVECNDGNNGTMQTIPILFRVHHSIGDGVALLRLLLEAIADKKNLKYSVVLNDNQINYKKNEINPQNYNNGTDYANNKGNNLKKMIPLLHERSPFNDNLENSSEIIYYSADVLNASMPFAKINLLSSESLIYMNRYIDSKLLAIKNVTYQEIRIKTNCCFKWVSMSVLNLAKRSRKISETIVQIIMALIMIPSSLVRQSILSKGTSAIHGPKLSGNKVIGCWMEDDYIVNEDDCLLGKIRDIKNITGTRFADVVLAALSTNLHKHFQRINETAPKTVTVVIPARMSAPTAKLSLKNGFSVGLLPLCVSEINGEQFDYSFCVDDADPWKLFDRLRDVSDASEKLRTDPDYLINYWVMIWLSEILPAPLLKPVLHSSSTLVFSNLPGPKAVDILGNTLKKVAFWIPHRGTTGIGCAFLSYNGKVHFSIVADKAIIDDESRLDEIITGTVDDIKKMHENIQLSYFSKNRFVE